MKGPTVPVSSLSGSDLGSITDEPDGVGGTCVAAWALSHPICSYIWSITLSSDEVGDPGSIVGVN
jgi:hypothetical protein